MATAEERLTQAQAAVASAQTELQAAVLALCPGPHTPTQHRDMRPPWCPVCRRTAAGTPVDVLTRRDR